MRQAQSIVSNMNNSLLKITPQLIEADNKEDNREEYGVSKSGNTV